MSASAWESASEVAPSSVHEDRQLAQGEVDPALAAVEPARAPRGGSAARCDGAADQDQQPECEAERERRPGVAPSETALMTTATVESSIPTPANTPTRPRRSWFFFIVPSLASMNARSSASSFFLSAYVGPKPPD